MPGPPGKSAAANKGRELTRTSMPNRSQPRRRKPAPQHARPSRRLPPDEAERKSVDDKIDESLKETFPASDPPAWIPVTTIGTPRREPDETA